MNHKGVISGIKAHTDALRRIRDYALQRSHISAMKDGIAFGCPHLFDRVYAGQRATRPGPVNDQDRLKPEGDASVSALTRANVYGQTFRKVGEWSPHLIPLADANRRLSITRQNSYRLIGRGEYPVETIRVGHRWFCRVADIDALTTRRT